MNIRVPLVLSLALVAVMTAAGFWAWHLLPPGTLIAVHWGLDGKPNGYARGGFGFFVIPAIAGAVTLLLALLPRIEPRRFNLAASAKFYSAVWIGAMLLVAIAQAMIVTNAVFRPVDGRAAITAALSVLFIVIGNYLGKTRSNFIAGIRTPWTLSSDLSWEKTHRLGGRLFIATGAIALAVLVTAGSARALETLLPLLFASIAVSIAMSYVYWKRDPDRQRTGAVPE